MLAEVADERLKRLQNEEIKITQLDNVVSKGIAVKERRSPLLVLQCCMWKGMKGTSNKCRVEMLKVTSRLP